MFLSSLKEGPREIFPVSSVIRFTNCFTFVENECGYNCAGAQIATGETQKSIVQKLRNLLYYRKPSAGNNGPLSVFGHDSDHICSIGLRLFIVVSYLSTVQPKSNRCGHKFDLWKGP